MSGVETVVISVYLYILGRALTMAGREARREADESRERWKLAEQKVEQTMVKYSCRRMLEQNLEKERGLEVAGTLSGGVAAPPTPDEGTGEGLEDPHRGPAKKGNAQGLMAKVTSLLTFTKSKND